MGACLQPPCFKKYFHKMDNLIGDNDNKVFNEYTPI